MTREVRIREAHPTDLDAIAEVHTRARTAYYTAGGVDPQTLVDPAAVERRKRGWSELLGLPEAAVLCAVDGRQVIGLLAMGPPHDQDVQAASYRQLFQIHVDPDAWGEGVGRALHDAFVGRLRAAGFTGAVLEVWEANARARAFYARQGWREDGVRRPGPEGKDYLRLRLELVPPTGDA
ncbi:MAG: GNAT family N-acetyltransferase [Nocardioides sp.]